MNHWWRAYNEAVNDPKLQLLSDSLFRAWFNLMCIASANDGKLPSIDSVAFTLRMKVERAAQILAQLHKHGLLDKTETGFVPHNWAGRQYKSDVSTERVKRFRNAKRNGQGNVSVTPPDTETDTETEYSEAKASDADASSPRDRLFDEGLKKLKSMTGKGEDSCRTFLGKCLKSTDDDASRVLGLIDDASRNQVADAPGWISARLKAKQAVPSHTEKISMEEAIGQFAKLGHWSRFAPVADISQAPPELLAKHGLLPDGRRMQ